MPSRTQKSLGSSRAPAVAQMQAEDRSAWWTPRIEALAVASVVVVFAASALEAPQLPASAHAADPVVAAPRPSR
jgi:hypothetical protein